MGTFVDKDGGGGTSSLSTIPVGLRVFPDSRLPPRKSSPADRRCSCQLAWFYYDFIINQGLSVLYCSACLVLSSGAARAPGGVRGLSFSVPLFPQSFAISWGE